MRLLLLIGISLITIATIVPGNVGRIQQAIQDFDAQIEIDPRHTNAFGGRAQAYSMVGDAQRALADVERGLELQPAVTFGLGALLRRIAASAATRPHLLRHSA
jgi:tetratricopeptide (TPR) repeat protein